MAGVETGLAERERVHCGNKGPDVDVDGLEGDKASFLAGLEASVLGNAGTGLQGPLGHC